MAWLQAHLDWAGHMLEATVQAAVVGLPFWLAGFSPAISLLIGGAFGVGHFHGREKRDHEVANRIEPPHLVSYAFWKWSRDTATDFWPVVALYLLVIGLLFYTGAF